MDSMTPPARGEASYRVKGMPRFWRRKAAVSPVMPAPMMATEGELVVVVMGGEVAGQTVLE